MRTVLIKNVMSSLLDMSVIKDVHGNAVTLRPKGLAGDRRECPEAVVNDEVVQRVKTAGWIEIESTAVAPPEPVKEPAKDKPVQGEGAPTTATSETANSKPPKIDTKPKGDGKPPKVDTKPKDDKAPQGEVAPAGDSPPPASAPAPAATAAAPTSTTNKPT